MHVVQQHKQCLIRFNQQGGPGRAGGGCATTHPSARWPDARHLLRAVQRCADVCFFGPDPFPCARSEKGRPIDVRRTALTSAFGGACIGPCGHLWYSHLDKLAVLFGPEASARWLLGKIFLDSTLWNVFYMSAFFLWGEVVIDRGNLKTFAEQMQVC